MTVNVNSEEWDISSVTVIDFDNSDAAWRSYDKSEQTQTYLLVILTMSTS